MRRALLALAFLLPAAPALAKPATALHPGPCKSLSSCVGDGCGQLPASSSSYEAYTWDAQGRLRTLESTSYSGRTSAQHGNSVSVYHSVVRWTLDGQGRPVRVTVDQGGDGKINIIETLHYAPDAAPVKVVGPPRDDHERHSPTARHRPVKVESDTDADGKVNVIEAYTYDPDGRLLVQTIDGDADGKVDHTITHTLVKGEYQAWSDHDYPDSDEMCVTHPTVTRDKHNRIIKTVQTANICDADVTVTYTHDAHGNLLTEHHDEGHDGDVDLVVIHDYSCW